MKKVIFLVFSVFVCVALLAACSGTVDPTDETSAVPSNSEVSNLLPDNSDSSAEPSENSTASEDVSGEESSAVVENPDNDLPVLLEVRTEIGDKMTVDYLEYDNGNTFEKVIIYEDDEKTIRESETLKKDGEVLSVTEYENGEQSKSTYFIEGEILFYKEAFEVSAEEADYFGSTGENTYDSSNRLLKSHYGKSAVYYLEDGEVYYQCYDDPSDPWDMWLYKGFTSFYDQQDLIAEYLSDETGAYLSVKSVGDGYTEQQAEDIIKKVHEYRDGIYALSDRWQSYVNESY